MDIVSKNKRPMAQDHSCGVATGIINAVVIGVGAWVLIGSLMLLLH